MQLVRAAEDVVRQASLEGRFDGPVHVSLGQEAVAVGIGAALEDGDALVSNHRGHGHALAFGLDPDRVLAEIVGHPSGYSGGRGGSMHIFDPDRRFLGTNGIVGDPVALAAGAALSLTRDDPGKVAVVVIGDGAMGTGVVYECFNLAMLWKLPIVFVCENNGYAEMTPTATHLATEPTTRAKAFGLATASVDGNAVTAVRDAVSRAVRAARKRRPAFVEARCHRWGGHYVGDPGLYRPPGEDATWRDADPIRALAAELGLSETALESAQAELVTTARRLVDGFLNERGMPPAGAPAGQGGGS